MLKLSLILLAASTPVAMPAVSPGTMDSVWMALSSSPGLLAVIIVLVLNNRSEERRESLRQTGETSRQTSRQQHEVSMAARYERLINEIEEERRGNLAAMRELVGEIRSSHMAMFTKNSG